MDEQRHQPRHRTLKGGSIAFNSGGCDCTIRNLSDAGALLEIETPTAIPDAFTLIIKPEYLKRACTVIWRRDKRIGVHFAERHASAPLTSHE